MQVNCKCAETFSNMDNQEITSFNSFKPINNKKHSHLQKIPVQNAFSPEYEPPINNTYTVEKEEIVMSNFIIDDNDDDKISNIASPICDAPQLYMSPVSSASPITSSKIISCDSSPLKTSKLSAVSHAFNKLKNMISPNKVNDHSNITDDQRDVLLMLQRRNNNKSVFTIDINEIQEAERSKNIIISQNHMETLREVNAAEIEKKENKNITNDLDDGINIKTRKRNLEWITILNLYIAKTNDYCVFVYERHYFATRSSTENMLQLFMNADAHCQFSTCSCRLHAIISENGKLKVDYSGEIIHDPSELHSRPVRGSQRDELQKYTLLGSTPSAVRLHQLKGMSPANKAAGNRNAVGSSASVIRKIASEANVKLRRDKDLNESLKQLKVEQATKIFPAESIRGYLQEFNIEPLRLVCFTAAGIAIYNKFASSMPLSWDATGGIIVNRTRKIFYYELTISNLIKGGPSLPLTAMISASHGTMDIIHWLNCFIAKYKEAYGYSDVFPKPPVIHSDRALVFLLAGIQIFNNDETMDRYIERCWRIVNKTATKRDLEITVLHACLGHFMKNVKRNAAKELAKKQIPFGMWLMALLVNSNTLDEMIVIWRNICFVLLSPNQNDRFKMAISTLSKLAEQMNGDPEKTNYILQNVTVTSHASVTDKLNEQADDDGTNDDGLGEEEAVANMESSFKALFTSIYQETKEILKHYNNQQWQELPPNPLFSAGYLIRLLKQYMGIAPIWSNLLLGNFAQRYDYSSNDVRTPCMCHVGRTTGVSESQMRVLKETILHKKVYTRVDEVISLMGETIEAIEIQFTDYIFMNKQKNRVLPAKRHKPAQEAWNKRKPTKKQKGVYTSEKPPSNLVHMMNSQLLKKNDDILLDAEQPTQHFRFENKEKNSWFNSVCQMVFASRNLVETITQFGSIPASASVSDAITVTGSILHSFVTKSSYVEGKDAVVVAESIGQLLGHLRWAGVKICSRDNECVFKFFVTAIVSTLLYYKVDLQFTLNTSMECSSCGISSIITTQICDFLLLQKIGTEDILDNVVADLFGRTLQKYTCPECSDEGPHYSSMILSNCSKHFFVRPQSAGATAHNVFRLTPRINISKIISNKIIHTSSYARYTLQSFITFYEKNKDRQYVTYTRKKEGWFRLDDMDVKVITSTSIFQDEFKCLPVVLAHYIRPSETDVFSTTLFNVLTNFSRPQPVLLPTLSLNDAVNYFVQKNIIENNPLTLVVVKYYNCAFCKKETYAVDRMHEIWSMRSTATHINDKMASFVRKKIICSSCQKPGLTNSVVYDIPKFLVLNTRSNDADCVKLIDEVDLLFVQPIDMSLSFEYSIQTAIIVLEEDQVIYLRKNGNNYLSYNKTTNQFEAIIDLTTQQTGLASNWTIFIYKTEAVIFDSLKLETIVLDQSNLQSAPNVDVLCIGVVQGLLPLFPRPFKVSSIQMEQRDINILLNESGNINDLIVNSHLRLIASNAPANNFVLVLDSLLVSNILRKDLKRFDATWFNYDIILCPIQQNNHWYLIILDIKKKLIVEVDTLSTVDIPRTQNLTRLLHVLNIQWLLRHKTAINFEQHWKLATPIIDKKFQQTDAHSCGVHLLIQARAYVNNYKFVHIPQDKIRLYRYQLAEDILRQAELLSDSSDSEVSY
ncbi:unnamed protein product [Adineta steineri]|uniref:Ubiquitin-like protease family profile domain-containing protein n=1 Tax=Adineta steineri TaxID=433720 RepID=A0A815IDX9_9BILA|nr:unnamed protein product [Adineta steineri]